MPTPQILYSDDSGTIVQIMKPGIEPCTKYINPPEHSPPEPFVIYWQNSEGQKAKINVNQAMKNALREVRPEFFLFFVLQTLPTQFFGN